MNDKHLWSDCAFSELLMAVSEVEEGCGREGLDIRGSSPPQTCT